MRELRSKDFRSLLNSSSRSSAETSQIVRLHILSVSSVLALFCALRRVSKVLDGSCRLLENPSVPLLPMAHRAQHSQGLISLLSPILSTYSTLLQPKPTAPLPWNNSSLLLLSLGTCSCDAVLFSLPGELILEDPVLILHPFKSLWFPSPFHRPVTIAFIYISV